jgi:hypothetical protein
MTEDSVHILFIRLNNRYRKLFQRKLFALLTRYHYHHISFSIKIEYNNSRSGVEKNFFAKKMYLSTVYLSKIL